MSILSPGLSKLPGLLNGENILKIIQTCQCCCPADIHRRSELLDKDELLSVGVEDDDGDAAVGPHEVPELGPAPLPVLQPHRRQEPGLCQRDELHITDVLHCHFGFTIYNVLTIQLSPPHHNTTEFLSGELFIFIHLPKYYL